MRKLTIALAVLALAIPSAAFAADDHEGWFIGIEGGSLQAGGAETILGSPLNSNDDLVGKLLTLDYGSGTTYGFNFGYSNADSRYTVAYWQYDEDQTVAGNNTYGYLSALSNADLGTDFADTIDAMGNLKSHTIDLLWSRPIAENERSSFHWTIGLRQWELEQMTDVTYTVSTFTDEVTLTSKAQGIGLVAGVGAQYKFNDWMYGSTCLKLGFLLGDMDAGFAEDAFGTPVDEMLDGVDRNYRQTELDTRLNFQVADPVALYIGFQYKQFDDASTKFTYPDDVQEGELVDTTRSVSYSGFTVGANFTF